MKFLFELYSLSDIVSGTTSGALLFWVSKLIPAVKYVEFLVRKCFVTKVKRRGMGEAKIPFADYIELMLCWEEKARKEERQS